MKYAILTLSLLFAANTFAQVKATQGNNNVPFTPKFKHPQFSAYSTANSDYFVICKTEHFEKINTLVVADKKGNIISSKDVRFNMGTFNNNNSVIKVLVAGNTVAAFLENHNKDTGKNTLNVQMLDSKGDVSGTPMELGTLDFLKLNSPGDWFVSLTPDKKHIAIIGQQPHVKDTPDQFKYIMLDDNLKTTDKGAFNIAGYDKKVETREFLASDKGDFYILTEEFDKSYKYPTLFKAASGTATANMIPIMISDPGLKNFSYTASVNPAGDLIVAGYMQKKQTFSAGDTKTVGTWLFSSTKPSEVKTYMFDSPIEVLTARNIVYNGDTFFLIGEQYKEEAEKPTGTAMQQMGSFRMGDESMNYTHGNIEVTAFTNDLAKKFEMPISRGWKAHNFNLDLAIATGIMNNKLALIYNDQYGKYVDEGPYGAYKNYKLTVALLINNDGLMEAPVQFAKELDMKVTTYTLYPQFVNNNSNKLVLLSANAESVKTVTFQ